jgi:cytochrome P450
MQYYAFDVIGEITLGSRFRLLEEDCDKAGIIAAIDKWLAHAAVAGLVPEIHWLLCRVVKHLSMKPDFAIIMEFILNRIQDRVSGRTKSPDDRHDFLDKLLPPEQTDKATRTDTMNACGSNVTAGSDTTAITLTAAIAYLSMHLEVLTKLRGELSNTVSEGIVSDPITFKKSQKLPLPPFSNTRGSSYAPSSWCTLDARH